MISSSCSVESASHKGYLFYPLARHPKTDCSSIDPTQSAGGKSDGGIGEENDVAADHPDVVARIGKVMSTARVDNEFWKMNRE